jgi:hypothetical protein
MFIEQGVGAVCKGGQFHDPAIVHKHIDASELFFGLIEEPFDVIGQGYIPLYRNGFVVILMMNCWYAMAALIYTRTPLGDRLLSDLDKILPEIEAVYQKEDQGLLASVEVIKMTMADHACAVLLLPVLSRHCLIRMILCALWPKSIQ